MESRLQPQVSFDERPRPPYPSRQYFSRQPGYDRSTLGSDRELQGGVALAGGVNPFLTGRFSKNFRFEGFFAFASGAGTQVKLYDAAKPCLRTDFSHVLGFELERPLLHEISVSELEIIWTSN